MTHNTISRRHLLSGAAAAGGLALVGFDALFGYRRVFGQDAGDDAQTILNLAATAETLACTHYANVLTDSSIALTPDERATLATALDAELFHLEFLNANGGATLATEFFFPQNVYANRELFSEITEQAETAFVGAYLAAVRRITELGNPLLAATAAQIAVVEQAHLALVRQIGGRVPNHVSLGQAVVFNVSDAVPVLQPFLEGGDGRVGPSPFPGAEAIRQLIGDLGVLPVLPFTDPNVTSVTPGEMAPVLTAAMCSVTPRGSVNINIRAGAGISNPVINLLQVGTSAEVNGIARGSDGFDWYRVTAGGFVRTDVVAATGSCDMLTRLG